MSYSTIAISTHDTVLIERINAAVAQEQKSRGEPIEPLAIATPIMWAVVTASDVEAAYASALAGDNPSPGGDDSVITDGMILANVQANWPEPDA